ncbi:agmatinase [Clostridiales bacterium PH28_bin88]|nr:agmatinase [Clostridiales bacterium PH28_bin88]
MTLQEPRFLGQVGSYRDAGTIVFGLPMDFTVSFRAGARAGPQHVRKASLGLETYSVTQDRYLEEKKYHDIGDVVLPFGNVLSSLSIIEEVAKKIVADGKFPLALGGEHLVSYPLVKALAGKYPDLAVLHFDAHADLRDQFYGESLSHATVLRLIAGLVPDKQVYQFGIRSGCREEFQFAMERTNLFKDDVLAPLRRVLPGLRGKPVYVTLDIDVVDPAFAPGTGTPEPGGCGAKEILEAVCLLGELNVVGFDLVEVSPAYDLAETTALLAAKIVREAILAFCP